ncbi:MAG: hypothetical protein PHF86_06925 [Candidatus Nanoarchaeia archaeon]|nr:hypothetical protein [Candidatus Nanoarchaeia archaeon]
MELTKKNYFYIFAFWIVNAIGFYFIINNYHKTSFFRSLFVTGIYFLLLFGVYIKYIYTLKSEERFKGIKDKIIKTKHPLYFISPKLMNFIKVVAIFILFLFIFSIIIIFFPTYNLFFHFLFLLVFLCL